MISNLLKLSNRELALFVADKGFTNLESRQIQGLWPQRFSVHGSFSFDVNFDALSRFIEHHGGTSLTKAGRRSGLCTGISIVSRKKKNNLEHLRHYFKTYIVKKDLVNALSDIEELISKVTYPSDLRISWVETIASIVHTYNFEPVVFTIAVHRMFQQLKEELHRLEAEQKADFIDLLKRVYRNIYVRDLRHDALDCILRLLVELKSFDECLKNVPRFT